MQDKAEKTILYRYFDAEENLLYVGITRDQSKRFSSHNRQSKWMPMAVRCTLEHFETRAEAKAAETIAIQNENPVHNISETSKQLSKSIYWRLTSETHLMQMTGKPDEGFDYDHREFQKDFVEAIYGLPATTGFDYLEFLAFSYDLLKSNTTKTYPNLAKCEYCLDIENSLSIKLATERAKIKLAGVTTL
jgi:predicted GIY-YIG superfamily endonuclease